MWEKLAEGDPIEHLVDRLQFKTDEGNNSEKVTIKDKAIFRKRYEFEITLEFVSTTNK